MLRNFVVAKRYAHALFNLSRDKVDPAYSNEHSKILQELQSFRAALQSVTRGQEFFLSPVISKDEKRDVLSGLKEKLPLTHRFLVALVDNNRMDAFSDIAQEFERMCEDLSGQLSVRVEVAQPLTPGLEDEIKLVLQERWKREIKIKGEVRPEILGGFIVRAPGKIFDASVSTQIEHMKQQVLS